MFLEDLSQNGLCGLAAAERGLKKAGFQQGWPAPWAPDNCSSHLLPYVISCLIVKVKAFEAFELQLAIITSKAHALNTSPHSPLYASPEGKKMVDTLREATWH